MAFRTALSREPNFFEAHYNLAQTREKIGKTEEAASVLDAAITLQPGHADAHFNLAQLKREQGDLDGAQQLYSKLISLNASPDMTRKARQGLAMCRAV